MCYTKPVKIYDKRQRLWSRIIHTVPDDCWEWQGVRRPSGYGKIGYGGKQYGTHRLAWTLTYGEIPTGLFVCHRCDNPPCINPRHLFLGTAKDNSQDCVAKGKTRGGERSRFAKLTDEQVRAIKTWLTHGHTASAVAKRFGVAYLTVYRISREKIWRCVRVDSKPRVGGTGNRKSLRRIR